MSDRIKLFAIAGLGISAAAISSYYYLKQKRKFQTPPTNWKLVGKLNELIYYPIKSCAGITLNSANCDILGIVDGKYKDRQFILLNENHKLVSATTYPKMLKIKPKIIDGNLYVTAPNMEQLKIDYLNFVNDGRTDIKGELWEKPVYVTECGDEYNKWFSKFLLDNDTGLKLVYYPFPTPTKSIFNRIYKNDILANNGIDVCSYMLLNIDSVNDLNTKLKDKLTHKSFRGNFIAKTTNGEAFAEDNWNWIKIGNNAIFHKVSPCYRCIFTNINPFTAERNPDFQPLKTLKKYRCFGDSKEPEMGIQMSIWSMGVVKTGDNIYVGNL